MIGYKYNADYVTLYIVACHVMYSIVQTQGRPPENGDLAECSFFAQFDVFPVIV